jgi:hypothetical protein
LYGDAIGKVVAVIEVARRRAVAGKARIQRQIRVEASDREILRKAAQEQGARHHDLAVGRKRHRMGAGGDLLAIDLEAQVFDDLVAETTAPLHVAMAGGVAADQHQATLRVDRHRVDGKPDVLDLSTRAETGEALIQIPRRRQRADREQRQQREEVGWQQARLTPTDRERRGTATCVERFVGRRGRARMKGNGVTGTCRLVL